MNFFVKRILAALIDGLIIGIPIGIIEFAFGIIRFILSLLPILNHFRFLFSTSLLFLIVYSLYEGLMVYFGRKTIGKMIMGISIHKTNDTSFGFGDAMLRGLCKAISLSFIPLGVLSFILACVKQNSSIHDVLLGTSVWED